MRACRWRGPCEKTRWRCPARPSLTSRPAKRFRPNRPALRELSQGDDTELTVLWCSVVDRISYVGCVLLVMLFVLTFLMIKIVPEYAKIFEEFELELPAPTLFVVETSNVFVQYFAVPTLLAAFLLIVGSLAIWLCYLCDFHVLRPWADRIFRGRRTADILRILAVAADERRPIAAVLNRLAHVYPSPTIRRQLAPAASAVNAGGPGTMRSARCTSSAPPRRPCSKSAEQAGNLPWALRQIAKRREKRSAYRLASALQIVYPMVILLLGAVIGFYVIALFIPIVKLIQGLT